ncbi:hypothetical protein B0H13DRAFT_2329277 [Mycena leptocephala]|nr:hypothetical protein B0H13DRAFT_2329277 [Mycena leptocephala]
MHHARLGSPSTLRPPQPSFVLLYADGFAVRGLVHDYAQIQRDFKSSRRRCCLFRERARREGENDNRQLDVYSPHHHEAPPLSLRAHRVPAPTAGSSPERSQMSTPPVPPSPPPAHGHPHPGYATYEMPRGFQSGYMYAPPPPPAHYPRPDDNAHAHPHAYAPQPFPGGYVSYPLPGTWAPMAAPQKNAGPPPAGVQVVHTDDAATKLSDRVRRRCFNCCTTDTSTWRRSNLSPGKVLCNKCGLFERTHSRPRPEQFPHKRGPLASSTLRAPPMHPQQTYQNLQPQPQPQTYQPPIAESLSAPAPHHHQDPAPAPPQQYQHASVSHPGTPNPNAHNNNSRDGRRGEHAEPSASPQPREEGGRERDREGEEDTHTHKVSGKKEVAGRRRRSPA